LGTKALSLKRLRIKSNSKVKPSFQPNNWKSKLKPRRISMPRKYTRLTPKQKADFSVSYMV